MISLILPAYREEEYIETTLESTVTTLRAYNVDFEVVIVLDRVPNDKTGEIIDSLAIKYPELRVISREGKRGIGNAIRVGIRLSKGDIVIIIMGDASEDPKDVIKLIQAILAGYDMAFGSRFIKGSEISGYPLLKYMANRSCNYLIKALFRIHTNDITNAFKAYKAGVVKRLDLKSDDFQVFVELPLKAYLSGFNRIVEVPVHHYVRKKGNPQLMLKNVGPKYLRMILSILLKRKNHRNFLKAEPTKH